MRARRIRVFAGIAALAGMLFLQAAYALANCERHEVGKASMVQNSAPCHESGKTPDLCAAHCQGGEQTLTKPPVKIPDFSTQPVLALRGWQSAAIPTVAAVPRTLPPPAAPPPRILFQSLLL
jgi:hypothetical protein